jgi:hypothetical protein
MTTLIKTSLLSALLTFIACNPEIIFDPSIPQCIKELVDSPDTQPLSIKSQVSDDGQHYWINTGAVNFDGVEYIVNRQCDTVCFMCGECTFSDCMSEYNSDNWITLWQK